MDLFTHNKTQKDLLGTPLAERLRPKSLNDFLGQKKVLGEQTPLRRMIENGTFPSLILWGPPGCGKTSFAELLANHIEAEFISLNAVTTGAKELKQEGEAAKQRRLYNERLTIVFIDEIHRLNKAQQDVLLSYVERGDIRLVGATTENPSFEINSALLSRCRLLVFESLAESELVQLYDRAFELENLNSQDVLMPEAKENLLNLANNDARNFLNLLEQVFNTYQSVKSGAELELSWPLSEKDLQKVFSKTPLYYDKKSEQHYDTISAFIKSIRGSNPDAAIYYLARMIKGGEDPIFIARRLVVAASEDVGNADPRALSVAVAGLQAVQTVGLPEAGINLAQVTSYLASAPKSNRSYMAYKKALETVSQTGNLQVPMSLRNAPTKLMKNLGYGKDYKYAHDYDKSYVEMDYLPKELKGSQFYEPKNIGFEKQIIEYQKWIKS